MSKVLVTENYLSQIASAIRSKLGGSAEYRPGDMSAAILSIPTGGITPTGTVVITENGIHNVTQYADADVQVQPNLQSKTVTQNGTVTPDQGYDGLSQVVVNVSGGGGGGSLKGFELYAADGNGYGRQHKGTINNQYFVCYFDDNMSSTYTLNGQSYTFSTIAAGKQQTLATTKAVADNQNTGLNAIINNGCLFTASHGDSGSYVSVAGGWVGYSTGGVIFENASTGTSNSITLNAAYSKLLVFIGGCFDSDGVTSVEINGTTYSITNIGYHYGAYGVYGAIEISGNSATTITANFSQSGWSYMSIIGINE